MGAMHFHTVKARGLGAPGRGDEVFTYLHDFIGRQRACAGFQVFRGAYRCADDLRHGPASAMVKLQAGDGAARADAVCDAPKARQVRVAEGAELSRKPLAIRLDMRRAGEGEAEAAFSAHHQPAILVPGQRPVGMTLLVGQGGKHQPVGPGRSARQCERGEEVGPRVEPGHGGSVLHGVQSMPVEGFAAVGPTPGIGAFIPRSSRRRSAGPRPS